MFLSYSKKNHDKKLSCVIYFLEFVAGVIEVPVWCEWLTLAVERRRKINILQLETPDCLMQYRESLCEWQITDFSKRIEEANVESKLNEK